MNSVSGESINCGDIKFFDFDLIFVGRVELQIEIRNVLSFVPFELVSENQNFEDENRERDEDDEVELVCVYELVEGLVENACLVFAQHEPSPETYRNADQKNQYRL